MGQIEVSKVFADKTSGKNTQCLELESMLAYFRESDAVAVHSMDKQAPSLDDLCLIVQRLTQQGGRMEFVKEVLMFTGDDSSMVHQPLLLTSVRSMEQ